MVNHENIIKFYQAGNSLELSTVPSLKFLTDIYNIQTPKLERKYNKYLSVINSRI